MTYSLSKRHQNLQVYHLLNENYFKTLSLGTEQKINKDFLDFIKLTLNAEEVDCFNWIEINNTKYQLDDLVVTHIIGNMPTFACIKSIVLSKQEIVFIIKNFTTREYVNHKTGYILENNETMYTSVRLDNLINPFPLDLYDSEGNYKILIPKYPLV